MFDEAERIRRANITSSTKQLYWFSANQRRYAWHGNQRVETWCCRTNTLIINQKKQTKNVQKNNADAGNKKRKTTGQQSAIRSTKESLPSTSGTSSRPTKCQKKRLDKSDPANIYGVCEGNYCDDTDLQDGEG